MLTEETSSSSKKTEDEGKGETEECHADDFTKEDVTTEEDHSETDSNWKKMNNAFIDYGKTVLLQY